MFLYPGEESFSKAVNLIGQSGRRHWYQSLSIVLPYPILPHPSTYRMVLPTFKLGPPP